MFARRTTVQFLSALTLTLALAGCASLSRTTPAAPEAERFQLNVARYGHAAVYADGQIYVIGGANDKGFNVGFERIDPEQRTSTFSRPELMPRRYGSAVWDGENSIYIFGGTGYRGRDWITEPLIEMLDIRTGSVSRIEIPDARRYGSAVRIGDTTYIVGGSVFTENNGEEERTAITEASSKVSSYNFELRKMGSLPDLPYAAETRAFAYNNWLCALGGYNEQLDKVYSDFHCLNPNTNVWERLPDAPTPLSAHSVAVHEDTLYVFGDYTRLSQVLTFDFNTGEWATSDFPLQPRRHSAAVVVGDEIFVIGGTTDRSGASLDSVQVFDVSKK